MVFRDSPLGLMNHKPSWKRHNELESYDNFAEFWLDVIKELNYDSTLISDFTWTRSLWLSKTSESTVVNQLLFSEQRSNFQQIGIDLHFQGQGSTSHTASHRALDDDKRACVPIYLYLKQSTLRVMWNWTEILCIFYIAVYFHWVINLEI